MSRTIVGIIIGFLAGVGWLHLMDKTKDTTALETKAYNKGFNAALDASRPSDRLEAVCAALWFKGNTRNDNNN